MDKKQENKYILTKTMVNLIIIVIGALLVGTILKGIQQATIKSRIQKESEQILQQISTTIEKNRNDVEQLTEIYHSLNQSTVSDLAELIENGLFDYLYIADNETKVRMMEDIVERANTPYLFLMDEKSNIIAAPSEDILDKCLLDEGLLSQDNLKALITSGKETCHVLETNESGSYYFYSDVIETQQGKYYLVFGTNEEVLEKQFETLNDVTRIVKNVVVGENGFIFVVDKANQTFIYYKDANGDLTGGSINQYGLSNKVLEDHYVGKENINGVDYFCVSKDCGQYTIAVAANEWSELYNSGSYSLKWSITGFIAISLMCLLYAVIVRNDYLYNEKESQKTKAFSWKNQTYYFNKSIFRRMVPVILLGVIMIFGISFFSTTILEINKAITDSSVNINELENNFVDANLTKKIVQEYYENQYLAKTRILAYIFEENPSALNAGKNKEYYIYDENNIRVPVKDEEGNILLAASKSALLQQYCDKNNINAIYIFDQQGRTIATNLADWYFQLSFNSGDQSYPFRQILDGKIDYYIQEMGTDEAGRSAQYIGTTFSYYTTVDIYGETLYVSRDQYQQYLDGQWEGNPITKHNSLLQIGLDTTVMSNILQSTDYKDLLRKSAINNGYLVLFDASEDHINLYSPKEESIGKAAADLGLNKNAFNGNYIGFQRANGIEYLIDIQYYEGYYIGTAILKDNLFVDRVSIASVTAISGFVFILLMSSLILFSSENEEEIYARYAERVNDISDRIMFVIHTPTGERSVTEKAASRWDNKNIPWSEKTPEQKLAHIFFVILAAFIINSILFTFMVSKGRVDDAVLSYILSGNWDKGFNVFALSACGLVLVSAIVLAQLSNVPIRLVTSIFGTKSETIGHLLASVIKYAVTIYSIFYCLYLLGFNSTSLITSAGILSLVVGLGSQSLIKDVVAGIFIIFEGSFRVGDIVTIGNYRGQVLDVGLRTTKIMASDHNIKIINNNDVNGVINMTRVSSLCNIEVPVAFGVSISKVEEILNKELPLVKDKIDGILDGPYYNGVVRFDHKQVMIKISALCKEQNIEQVRSGLNRETIDIIYKNGLHESKPKA